MCGEFGLCFRDHCNIDMKSAGFVLEKVGSNSVILMLISILICIKGVQPDRIDVFHWHDTPIVGSFLNLETGVLGDKVLRC